MFFLSQEKKGEDDGWFDPFGPTIPSKDKPTSPAEVEIPKAPPHPDEAADTTAELIGILGVLGVVVLAILYARAQRGDGLVSA